MTDHDGEGREDSSSAPIATHTHKPMWAPGSRFPDGTYDDDAQLVFVRPDWHRYAMCRGSMSNGHCDWFPRAGGFDPRAPIERAIALCRVCPVREQCASSGGTQEGVWGGVLNKRGDGVAARAS